jgi:hypothetical protein
VHDDMVDEWKMKKKDKEEDRCVQVRPGSVRVLWARRTLVEYDDECRTWLLASSRSFEQYSKEEALSSTNSYAQWWSIGRRSGSRCRAAVSRQSEICSPLILLWATSPNRNYLVEVIKIVDVGK